MNYLGPVRFGKLGVRKPTVRASLYPWDVEDAVILYTPPELSPQDMMNQEIRFGLISVLTSSDKHPVHVVVDPVVGKKLRPHQIEVR